MKPACLPILTVIGLSASTLPVEAKSIDIVEIGRQFAMGGYAAEICLKPDARTMAGFENNFRTVRSTEEMMKRNPLASERQITAGFKKETQEAKKKINKIIMFNGCSDFRIQDLPKRFAIQSTIKF